MPTKQTKQTTERADPTPPAQPSTPTPPHRPSELALFSRVVHSADEKELAFLNRLLDSWLNIGAPIYEMADLIEKTLIEGAKAFDVDWIGADLIDRPDNLKKMRAISWIFAEETWLSEFIVFLSERHEKEGISDPEEALRLLEYTLESFHSDVKTAKCVLSEHPEALAVQIRAAAAKLEARNA
jgi:hypothetical protein